MPGRSSSESTVRLHTVRSRTAVVPAAVIPAAAARPAHPPAPPPVRVREAGFLRTLFACCLPRPRPAAPSASAVATDTTAHSAPARPLTARSTGLPSPAAVVTDRVTRLVLAGHPKEAGRVFAAAALGAASSPENCCALMQWLDGMCSPQGQFGRQWDAARTEGKSLGEARADVSMVVAFGRAGAPHLGAAGSTGADAAAAISLLAAAYELPGFPRMVMSGGDGSDGRLSWMSWPRPPARWIVRWWVGALLSHLPVHSYERPDSMGHSRIPRPAHHRLVELLRYCGGASLASALLYLWAQSFGQSPKKGLYGVFEPHYLDKGSECFFRAQSAVLHGLVHSLAGQGMPQLPLQSVAICLAAGLYDSQECDTEASGVTARTQSILRVAFPRAGYRDYVMPSIPEPPQDPSGLSLPVRAPAAIWSQPGQVDAKLDEVTAWFKQVISVLGPAEFAAQRASVYALLLDREKMARRAIETGPTATSTTTTTASAAGRTDRSVTATASALSLDDREADDDLIERHAALHMLYASYTEALKPLLHLVDRVAGGRDGKRAATGSEQHLIPALAMPCLRRHADIVAQEEAWLASWRDRPWARTLGANNIGVNLRELDIQLRQAMGRAPGEPARPRAQPHRF